MAYLLRAAMDSGKIKKLIVALLLGSAMTTLATLRLINGLDRPVGNVMAVPRALPSETRFTPGVKSEAIGNIDGVVPSLVRFSRPSGTEFFNSTKYQSIDDHYVGAKNVHGTNSSSIRKLHAQGDGQEMNVSRLEDPRWLSRHKQNLVTVLVLSSVASSGTVRRSVIRATWLSVEMTGEASFTYWFVLGMKNTSMDDQTILRNEQSAHGDLLMMWDVYNSYEDLSKRILHSIHYIFTHYSFTYFLKTDDDMFLNMPVLFHEMEHIRPRKRLYWGSFSCHNPPQTEGRWLETRWHSCDVYYPYAYGGMYILTRDVVELVAHNAHSFQVYANEDVSMGVWLAPYNLHRLNDARIYILHGKRCSRGFVAIHSHRSLSGTIRRYECLKEKGIVCSQVMNMEVLSWDGFPTECLWNDKRIA